MVAKMKGHHLQAKLFRALSHPVRLRILEILFQQEACVCHLGAVLGRSQPYVSQQLATLREAGLVTDRREGTLIYYRPAVDHLQQLLLEGRAVVEDITGGKISFYDVPEEPLEDCPCPRCRGGCSQ